MIQEFPDGFSVRTGTYPECVKEWAYFRKIDGWTREQVAQVVDLLNNKSFLSMIFKR